MADNARTADICPRIYRDKTALGQRVWPRQIDSASSLLRVTLRYCEHYGRVPCHGFSFIFPVPPPPPSILINRANDKAVAIQPADFVSYDSLSIIMIYEPRNENLALFLKSLVKNINVHFCYFSKMFTSCYLSI